MLIRPACSAMTLDESMEKAKEVLTQESLIECLKEDFCGDVFNLDTLQCKEYCFDERIGWMTYLLTASFETATYGNGVCVTFDNDQEYYCYKTYEDAEEASNEYNKDLLDDIGISGIRFENIGGIEEYVDTDWFEDATREDAEFYVSDLKESNPEQYKEEFGDLDEEDAAEKLFVNMGDDYVEWFKENFGEKELEQVIKQNNLVDYDKLAEAITEADGPAHGLAGYDGKEIELPCGYYCYRWN